MPKGGERPGAGRKVRGGRKAVSGRVAIMVRIDKSIEEQVELERVRSGGKSLSATVERLLKTALATPQSDDEAAASSLGFVLGQAAHAANSGPRNWQNDPATTSALKIAIPAIIDYFAALFPDKISTAHPLYHSPEEHARTIYLWILQMIKLRGDEYGDLWDAGHAPAGHPLRNFPRAAAALNVKINDRGENNG